MIADPLSTWLGFLTSPAAPRSAMSPMELDGYTPIVGTSLVSNLTLSDHMFMSPRISAPSYNDGSTTFTCS
jgi:hypothetical protein